MLNEYFNSRVNGRGKGLSPNGQKCSTYPQFSNIPNLHIIFHILYIFVFVFLIMPDTYLCAWQSWVFLVSFVFFLVNVLSLICLLIHLHKSVPALTFTTAFLHLNTERRCRCDFTIKGPEHCNIIWSTASNTRLLSRRWNTESVVLNNGSWDEVTQVSWRLWDYERQLSLGKSEYEALFFN